ncbi:MAG: AAA family ATPase [Polyangiaceae bacterium]|nr:AAA family ATPase [Polyangiaceae bacterium]
MTKTEFRTIQRKLFQALRDRPLNLMDEEDRKLYVPLHDNRHDPVQRLFDTIDFSEVQSVQLVAGFRGTGKTTEFSRLEKRLWESGYHVIRVDLDEYVDMHSAVDIRDFLLILAGAISDQLTSERLLGEEKGLEKSFWERMRGFIPTPKEVTAKAVVADVKLALRSDPSFRGQIREKLSGKLAELSGQVRDFHQDVLKALAQKEGREVRLVVILDSLEHLRGTGDTADDIRRSVEELFLTHANRISLPDTHMVLSVPAFLELRGDNLAAQFVNGAIQAWPAYQVRNRKGARTDVVDRMIQLVERRGDWRHILPDQPALEQIIVASGGYLRDLLNMLVEALHLASHGISSDAAEKIINVARRAYLPLYKDEIDVLRRVAERQNLQSINVEEHDYVLRFLDAGLILCYLNDDYWYDVHPLVRNVVLNP